MTIGTTATGEPLTAAVTPTSHATINHAGLPGVGDLSTAAHALVNHAGFPGVGNLATAPGAGLVDHTTLDHTGIPGVGGPVASSFTVLENTSTSAQINAALAAYRIVYLKPGTYPLQTATLQIPDHGQLIGLSSGPNASLVSVVFQWSTNITLIDLNGRGRVEGISFNSSTAGTQPIVDVGGSNGIAIIKNCFFSCPNWTGRFISGELACTLHLENIGIDSVVRTGSEPVIKNRPSGGNGEVPATFHNVRIKFNTSGAGSRVGILSQEGAAYINCFVSHASSHGYDFSEQDCPSAFLSCVAHNCVGNGFHHSSPGPWVSLVACNARNNTGQGFNLPFGGGTVIGSIVGSVAQTNTGGNTVQVAYLNSGNAFI